MPDAQDPTEKTNRDDVITAGSTWAAIWHMSCPLLIYMSTISLASFADTWVAGRLGSQALAAVGIGSQIWYLMLMMSMALSTGVTALVSRFWGARDRENAIEAARQSLVFGFFFGLGTATIALLSARSLLRFLGASPEVEELGWNYLKFDMANPFPYTILWVSNSIFRAKGNARTPMIVMALITTMVISLDLFLCLGPPHLGTAGIGIAWLVSGILGTSLSLTLLKQSDMGECMDVHLVFSKGLAVTWLWLKRLMNIGIPACFEDLAWVIVTFGLLLILAHTADPTACQATWGVGFRIEEILCGLPIHAFTTAIAVIVGQNLGDGQPERAELAGWQVAWVSAIMNTIVGLGMFFGASQISHLMSNDPKVIAYCIQFFQILGLSQPFVAVWQVLFGVMRGAGYTRWPMIASTICLIGIRLPLAWYLTIPLNLGPKGAWMAVALTSVLIGLIAIWRFKTGIWKYQKI